MAVLRALNHSNDEIAAAMGISERTLRTKYLPELKGGLAQKRAEAMVRLWELGTQGKGNVSALREFIRQTEKSDLKAPSLPRPRAKPPGKKEQAIIDASVPDAASSIGQLMARRAAMGGPVH